jgi:hypothetical protein
MILLHPLQLTPEIRVHAEIIDGGLALLWNVRILGEVNFQEDYDE